MHRNYITVQWLTYDKKSEYYYYGECSGIDGVHKYIYNPFLGFEAKSEENIKHQEAELTLAGLSKRGKRNDR